MAVNNMSNIHVSPDILSTLMSLQQDNLHKLQEQILPGVPRSSRPEVFCKKAALKTYAESTRKQLFWSLFLINLQAGSASNVIKKRL